MIVQTKQISWVLAFTCFIFVITVACNTDNQSRSSSSQDSDHFPYTVVDSNGKILTFDQAPKRIVALDSAVVEILFAIGEGDRIVGVHNFVSFPPEASNITKVGDAYNLNKESILDLNPDLVFLFSEGAVEDLEKLGLKVFYLETLHNDFRKIPESIRLWGNIVGNQQASNQIAQDFENRIKSIEEVMLKVDEDMSVFQDEGSLWTPGPDTMIGSVFDLLKLSNIAHDISGYSQLSPEIIVDRNPDIIIASYGDEISSNPAFSNIAAILNKKVFVPEEDRLSVAGPRYVEGIEILAKWVYPKFFK